MAVYTRTNPVAAGLLTEHHHWPGVISLLARMARPQVCKRPVGFFRENGPLPRHATLTIARRATCCAPDLGVGLRKITPFRGGGMGHPPVNGYDSLRSAVVREKGHHALRRLDARLFVGADVARVSHVLLAERARRPRQTRWVLVLHEL